jgi:hypothetical protein
VRCFEDVDIVRVEIVARYDQRLTTIAKLFVAEDADKFRLKAGRIVFRRRKLPQTA